MRNIISVLTGLMGSGKTCLLSRIFNKPPPSVYTSTGIAEQSFRGWFHHIGSISSSSLEPFSHENSLRFLSEHLCQDLIPVQIDVCEDISTPADTDLLPLPESTNISTSVTSSQPLSTANLPPTLDI